MKKMNTVVTFISSCGDCPHYRYAHERHVCGEVTRGLPPEDLIPDWCPLPDGETK